MTCELKPNEAMHYAGYISPNGLLYSCPAWSHGELAKDIVNYYYDLRSYLENKKRLYNPERKLESKYWIKLDCDGNISNFEPELVTDEQLEMINKLLTCEHHHHAPPPVIANSKYKGNKMINGSNHGWRQKMRSVISAVKIVRNRRGNELNKN